MASPLANLTPGQRQAVMVGVPVVAVFALSSVLGRRDEPDAEAPVESGAAGPAMTVPSYYPSTDAIGTGQLAEFESLLTGRINDLTVTVEEVGLRQPETIYAPPEIIYAPPEIIYVPQPAPPPPPPPPPAESYPAPPPPGAAPCSPPAGFPGIPGEVIIKRLDAPGGGCWYITNFGGVGTAGPAPFKGSAIGPAYRTGPGYENPPRYMVDAYNLGGGYRMVSNRGEHYDF